MKETFTLVATAAAGLEAVVGRELRELGYDTQVEMVRCVSKVVFVQLLRPTFG